MTTQALQKEIKSFSNEIQPHLLKTIMGIFNKIVHIFHKSCGDHSLSVVLIPNLILHTLSINNKLTIFNYKPVF